MRSQRFPCFYEQLALAGCIVTIDAMGTQTKIAAQIVEQEGDYALALKDNQGNLYEEVKATFAMAEKDAFAGSAMGVGSYRGERPRTAGNPRILDHQ